MLTAMLILLSVMLQLPLPPGLVDATTVYMQAAGVERRWLERAAEEVEKAGRWEMVATPEEADVVLTLAASNSGGGTLLAPISGLGLVALPMTSLWFQIIVHEAERERVLWDESRRVDWGRGGAVADLVKDMFESIAQDPSALLLEEEARAAKIPRPEPQPDLSEPTVWTTNLSGALAELRRANGAVSLRFTGGSKLDGFTVELAPDVDGFTALASSPTCPEEGSADWRLRWSGYAWRGSYQCADRGPTIFILSR